MEGSGVTTEESHEKDWSLASPSPEWPKKPWRLKLVDLGSEPFAVGAFLGITDTHT